MAEIRLKTNKLNKKLNKQNKTQPYHVTAEVF